MTRLRPGTMGRRKVFAVMPTVVSALRDVMRELRLTTMFGNPGSTEESFLADWPKDFRYVLGLHEASVIAMADGYAQATGEPALANVHTAAGVGNALGAIASAWHNRAPVIVIAGQQTREMLLLEPFLTNLEPTVLPKPYVKWSYEPARPRDVPGALVRAYAMAVQPPAGPVFLSLPLDDMDKDCPRRPATRTVSRNLPASPEALRPVAEALSSAASPGLVFGGAVDQCGGWEDAVRLAERLRCPVWAAPAEGRPGFPETHPLYRGPLPPAIGPLCASLEGRDVVVVVGAPVFRYHAYAPGEFLPQGTRLFHVSDDPAQAARAPVGDSVLADPARACGVLADLVRSREGPAPPPPKAPPAPRPAAMISAELLYDELNRARPSDSVLVQETPSNADILRRRVPTGRSRSYFSSSSGILGYGLPATVGVALAEQQLGTGRKVIGVMGDGSAQYAIQALWTAAREKLPILVVVPCNAEYAVLKAFGAFQNTPNVPGLDIPGIDYVRLAEGYGCKARRIRAPGELRDALRECMSARDPTLLQVDIDPSVPALLSSASWQ